MLRDWICRLLARMNLSTPLAQRLLTAYCKTVIGDVDGLYQPRYGLIAMAGKPYIWESPPLMSSRAYMTKELKRKLHKRERAGGTKPNIEENQPGASLIKSIKAKLFMILLLLLLLLTSLTE